MSMVYEALAESAPEITEKPREQLVLTVDDAAERLCVSRTLMYALVSSGEVESVRIGRLRRIPVDALSTFVESLRAHQKGAA